jgi:hypothetical protein
MGPKLARGPGQNSGSPGLLARVLIAANDALQALVTFCYWPADEGWAVPEWEMILSTLRLAGHSPDLAQDSSAGVADSQ